MDFELLAGPPPPPSPLDHLERLFTNRRKHWQASLAKPPLVMGMILLLSVSLELVLARRISHSAGIGISIAGQFIATTFFIFIIELLVSTFAAQAAELLGKKGSWRTVVTYLNLSLVPFFIFLPMTVISSLSGRTDIFRVVLFFLLALKVLGNWREALELIYKFSKLQSALVMYASSMVGIIILLIISYMVLVHRVVSVLIS